MHCFFSTNEDWRRYFSLLAARVAQDPQQLDALERRLNRGWCIGSATFKKAVSEDLEDAEDAVRLEGDALRDLNRQRWEESLHRCLRLLKKKPDDVEGDRRSARWNVAIAAKLIRETSATNAWIAQALDLGVPNAVSDYCGKYVRGAERDCPFAKKLNLNVDTFSPPPFMRGATAKLRYGPPEAGVPETIKTILS